MNCRETSEVGNVSENKQSVYKNISGWKDIRFYELILEVDQNSIVMIVGREFFRLLEYKMLVKKRTRVPYRVIWHNVFRHICRNCFSTSRVNMCNIVDVLKEKIVK